MMLSTLTLPSPPPPQLIQTYLSTHKANRLKLLTYITLKQKDAIVNINQHISIPNNATGISNIKCIHILSIIIPLITVIDILSREHKLSLFYFHPTFMLFGLVTFLTQALISRKDTVLFGFAKDIMNGTVGGKKLFIFNALQIIGLLLMFTGILLMVVYKIVKGKTFIPYTPHRLLGCATTAMLFIQTGVTLSKLLLNDSDSSSSKITLVPIIYDLSTVTMLTGLIEYLPWLNITTWVCIAGVLYLWVLVTRFVYTGTGRSTNINNTSTSCGENEEGEAASLLSVNGSGSSANASTSTSISMPNKSKSAKLSDRKASFEGNETNSNDTAGEGEGDDDGEGDGGYFSKFRRDGSSRDVV